MATGDFVGQIESGDFSVAGGSTPGWVLYLLTRGVDFSLTIAGVVMIGVTQGKAGYRRLGRRLVRWRFGAIWYVLALAPVLIYAIAAVLWTVEGEGSPNLDFATIRTILFSLSSGLLVSLFLRGALGEEIGLRGFALPRLQEQMTPARASLIVGVGWALWHLPALLDAEPGAAIAFGVLVMGLSFTFTWIFNGSGGSLIPPLLFHATQNWEDGFEAVFPSIVGSDWETFAAMGTALLSVVAVVAVVRSGRFVGLLRTGRSGRGVSGYIGAGKRLGSTIGDELVKAIASAGMTTMSGADRRYLEPDWFTRSILNPTVQALTRLGISFWGSRILEVRGRKSGEWRAVPVNLLSLDGNDYLVAPRGETQWVRNLRVAGEGRLKVGKRTTTFEAEELPDADKPHILRPYLERWKWEVGQFFDGVGPDASEEELVAIAPNHPVFSIKTRD
jgi:deazaflavin-dependent oxidoreductase (nitroreductase family)